MLAQRGQRNALLRFYVLHCMILPLIAILFIAVHFCAFGRMAVFMSTRASRKPSPRAPPRRKERNNKDERSKRFRRRNGFERPQVARRVVFVTRRTSAQARSRTKIRCRRIGNSCPSRVPSKYWRWRCEHGRRLNAPLEAIAISTRESAKARTLAELHYFPPWSRECWFRV